MKRLAMAMAILGAIPALAQADCRELRTLPVRITTGGTYCLNQDLTAPAGATAAILVEADSVVLDLGGHELVGRGGVAVQASGRRAVSVTNGTIRGFARGVALEGDGGLHRIEGLRIEALETAIAVEGRGNTIRRNRAIAGGIVVQGPLARVIDNDVRLGAGLAAIQIVNGEGAVIERNQLAGGSEGKTTGIQVASGKNVLVLNNQLRHLAAGVAMAPEKGIVRGNVRTQEDDHAE